MTKTDTAGPYPGGADPMGPFIGRLLLLDAGLVLLYFAHLSMGGWPGIANLDGEGNVGAWWGGGKLLVSGAVIAFVPLFARDRAIAPPVLYWVVAIGFVYLSMDEILELHERITQKNHTLDLGLPMFRGTNGAWVGVYAALFLVFLLLFHRAIRHAVRSDPVSAAWMVGGIALLVLGGVGAEVAGYYGALGGQSTPLQVTIEEGLELTGVSLALTGALRHSLAALKGRPPDT